MVSVWHGTFMVCLCLFVFYRGVLTPLPSLDTPPPLKILEQWFCPRVLFPIILHSQKPEVFLYYTFGDENSRNCHKYLYIRKTLCLPFLHSFGSLSLLILCIQNHLRAELYLLVLEPPSKLKPADGLIPCTWT